MSNYQPLATEPKFGSSSSAPQQEAPMSVNQVPRSFAKTLPEPQQADRTYTSLMSSLGACLGTIGSIPGCFCFPNPYKTVYQGNVGLVQRWGQYYRTVDPGLYWINPCTESIHRVDIKIILSDIPSQSVMTKDNCNIQIDSVVYWHIIDPVTATFDVQDVQRALVERTQTTLRQILGGRTLQECVENREVIAHEIESIISGVAASWGVKVESILIKDILFSQELQETLSAAAKQKRVGEAKVISAAAEVDAAKLMREASDILNTPAAMQIRYLDTLTSMAKSSGSKVIFMPTNANDSLKDVIDRTVLEGIQR
ncbi:hypothetical protein BJ742DRAFT_815157 [Cladochytrium replicatum]|nr:hypothetical protein BJ742DRAFT_815157 [Cladochytrium replicatum]